MNIAITGVGIISAIGNNEQETLKSLLGDVSGIGEMKHLQSTHHELPVGEVKLSNQEMKAMLGVPSSEVVSRTSLMGAIAINQAIENAGIDKNALGRVALINGTTVGGMDVTERYFTNMQQEKSPLSLLQNHDCGSSTQVMADICGIKPNNYTISTACSSALNSIILGAEMLKNNEVDVVIAGGSEALSMFHLNGFNTLMILDKERCRPFDENRAGLNLGEGAAFVVLERAEDAQNRSAKSRAYVLGYDNSCDAFHQTASSENGEGAYMAMTGALKMAGIAASEVDYINAHGTGTPNNDMSESIAIKRVFESQPKVSSTKSYTGHTTSASGSIETVITILAMENGFIPSNHGLSTPLEGGILPSVGVEKSDIKIALCNSFGFGGNDSSMVIGKEPGKESPASELYECIKVADVVIDSADQLKDIKEYISPMEARRMGKLIKAATVTSLKALKEAEIECPDAIITATVNGMIETSEKFLHDMCENGEQLLKPTLFMQSTHNTIGSAIAIRLKCHGYNITYSNGDKSLADATQDAKRLIATGKANSVLVGYHDESVELIDRMRADLGLEPVPALYSRSIVFKKK